ncbi:MAG: prohibitin family protein [Chloroflexota bacterium]
MNSITVVDAGTRGVLKTFGEVTDVYGEGLHFRMPFITTVVHVNVRTQRLESDSAAASRDLQNVTTQVVLNYRPIPDEVGELIRSIGVGYESVVIDPAVQESVKAATAQFTAEQLITQRPEVSNTIRDVLVERLAPSGIEIEALSITEFNFSEEFSRAIEAKQVAEQDALRAERELERAQIEARQQVAQAEAAAEARLARAQAEAEALRLQREVISPELLQLRYIEKWDGVLPQFTSGDQGLVPFVSVEGLEQQAQEPADTSASEDNEASDSASAVEPEPDTATAEEPTEGNEPNPNP